MKTLLLGMAAVSAVTIAAPAAAQYQSNNSRYQSNDYRYQNDARYGNQQAYAGEAGLDNRIANLDQRLQAGIRSGAIDRTEARDLRVEMRDLIRLEARYSADGLSVAERQELQGRIRALRQNLRTADNGAYDRYDSDDRYGWDDRDDRYGNRYGNRYGQGGPYDEVSEVCVQRSGIQGVLGTILGSDNCLRVGERVNLYGSLQALPAEYRNQFRDSASTYHRWVDGRVVEIDARNRTVTRIYDVGN